MAKRGAIVRSRADLSSPFVIKLGKTMRCVADARAGGRVRLTQPLAGWASWKCFDVAAANGPAAAAPGARAWAVGDDPRGGADGDWVRIDTGDSDLDRAEGARYL